MKEKFFLYYIKRITVIKRIIKKKLPKKNLLER